MTRLLLDENFPRSAARGLVAAGHDVQEVATTAPGIADEDVLSLARRERRCLVTFDADFGELVFRQGVAAPPSIVYLRVHPIVTLEVLALTLEALQQPLDGLFVVITREGQRRRPFVPQPSHGAD